MHAACGVTWNFMTCSPKIANHNSDWKHTSVVLYPTHSTGLKRATHRPENMHNDDDDDYVAYLQHTVSIREAWLSIQVTMMEMMMALHCITLM